MNTHFRSIAVLGLLASTAAACATTASWAQTSLYVQPLSTGGGVLRSSELWIDPSGENDLDSDAIAWENFTFAQDATVTRVRWCGQALPPLGFEIRFYNQDPNTVAFQPDLFSPPISKEIYPAPQVQAQPVGAGLYQFTLDLAAPLTFQGGKRYFIAVIGRTPIPYAEWKWAQGASSNMGCFWWSRGMHMCFHLGDDRALELAGHYVQAPLPLAYDGFDGPPLLDLSGSTGGMGWAGVWVDEMHDVVTRRGGSGLTYPGLATAVGGAISGTSDSGYPISRYSRALPAVPEGSNQIYVSFLMRADSTDAAWGGLAFGSYPHAMWVGSPPGMYAFGVMTSEGLGDISNAPLVTGQTNLVVVRISRNTPASGTSFKLYLNPQWVSRNPLGPLLSTVRER